MKKLYGLMGFIGFFIMLGGAGGADRVSFLTSLAVMCAGLFIIASSMLLIKSYNMKARKRRAAYLKRQAAHRKSINADCVVYHGKTPEGIAQIISGKINSLELC